MKAVNSTNAEEVVLFVKDVIANYDKPQRIISDRGTAYTFTLFENFFRDSNTQHVNIATSTPKANGQVERLNRVLLTCIATTLNEEGNEWNKRLFEVQWAVNNSGHRVSKRTPYELIFIKKGAGINTNPLTFELIELNKSLNSEEEKVSVSELLHKNRTKLKAQFDKKRQEARNDNTDEIVLVESQIPSTGTSRKLDSIYNGPYEVAKELGRGRYVVKDNEGEQQSTWPYEAIVAVDKIKSVPKLEQNN